MNRRLPTRTLAPLLGLAVALATSLAAQPARAQTGLTQAVDAALAHDPVYAAAVAQNRADATKRRQGRAGLLPQITATGNLRYGTMDQETTGARFGGGGFGSSNGISFDTRAADATGAGWAVTIKENLYSAQKSADAAQGSLSADMSDAALRLARQKLIVQVAQAYFDVLAAEDNVDAYRAIREAALQAGAIARARFDAGDSSITDASDAKARADLADAQMLAAQTDLQLKRAALADLTGLRSGELRTLPANTTVEQLPPGNFADWQARATAANPLIDMRRIGLSLAHEQVSRYRHDAGVSVDAFASYLGDRFNGTGFGGNSSMRSNSAVVGIMVTIPLYTGGLRDAQHDESVALLDKADRERDTAQITVTREVRQAYLGLRNAETQVVALRQALRSARLQLDANKTGFETGERPSIDVLNAQQALYGTRRDLASARYQVVLNRLRLEAAAGELDDSALRRIDTLLTAQRSHSKGED